MVANVFAYYSLRCIWCWVWAYFTLKMSLATWWICQNNIQITSFFSLHLFLSITSIVQLHTPLSFHIIFPISPYFHLKQNTRRKWVGTLVYIIWRTKKPYIWNLSFKLEWYMYHIIYKIRAFCPFLRVWWSFRKG